MKRIARLLGFLPALFAVSSLAVAPVAASTIHVPADQPTIQAGIDAATTGDIVLVAPGIYSGPGNRNLNYHGKSIELSSELGAEATIIDCLGSLSDPARGVNFDSGETPSAILDGFTIRNGWRGDDFGRGGAVTVSSPSNPTIRNCTFEHCLATRGGGIWAQDATITNCRLVNNTAFDGGGAGFCSATFVRCAFVGNRASKGAAAGSECSGTVTFIDCTFDSNTADWGSGVKSEEGSIVIRGCSFYGNSCKFGGAGVSILLGLPLILERTIIAFSLQGPAVSCEFDAGASVTCCDVFGNAGGDWVGCLSGRLGTNGNISQDPLFCDAAHGDLSLEHGSPCAPENSPQGCLLIGAFDVGCGPTPVEPVTWGQIKGIYR